MRRLLNTVIELIEGGYLAQTALVLIIWVSIAFLAITQRAIPDPLLDAGFTILGFYFHVMLGRATSNRQRSSGDD